MHISKSLPIFNLTPVILKTFWSIYSRWQWAEKFDFRWDWHFSGTWVRSVQVEIGLLGGSVFPTGTFYPSTNYVTFIMANWYRYPNFDIPKMGNIHFITLAFSFSDCFLNLKVKNTYCQVRKPSKLFKTILKYHKPVPSRKLVY